MRTANARHRHIAPPEWRERIKCLPWRLQPGVASVIWWDFFSQQVSVCRWPDLDDLINVTQPDISDDELINGLILLGWSRAAARRRIRQELPRTCRKRAQIRICIPRRQ